MARPNVLQRYAKSNLPEGLANSVLEADRLLHSLQIDRHINEVNSVLSISEDAEIETTMDRIREALIYTLEREISEYSIVFEDYDMDVMRQTLEALHQLPQHNNPSDLVEIIDDNGSAEERWADLMAFHFDQDPTDFLPHFASVNPSLLDKLSQTLNQRIEMGLDEVSEPEPGELEQQDEPKQARHQLKQFMSSYNPPRFRSLLDDGYQLGYSIQHYLDEIIDVDAQSKRDVAHEYIAAALASGDTVETAIDKAGDRLDEYLDETAAISEIVSQMQELRGALT